MTEQAQPRRRRLWRVVRWTAAGVVLLLVGAGIVGYLAFRQLDSNIKALRPELGENRPGRVTVIGRSQPLNVLVIGSDTRQGQRGTANPGGGDLSDTTILLHLSADRTRAYAVSIPRDLIVSRPACPSKSGTGMVPADPTAMFNSAYGVGREGCTIRTVEAMTNIRIDHFVVVRFDGLIAMADALDGVPVCVPETVDDPGSGIYIPAGRYDAKGDVALSYVRARLGIGNGSDIGRMKRQQAFLAAMVNKTMSLGTLANPVKLYGFLESVTRAVEVDEGLASLRDLAGLARQVRTIGLENVHFLTMPIAPYAPDPNRLAVGPGADALWERLRHDRALTAKQLEGGTTAATTPDQAGAGDGDSFGPSGGRSFLVSGVAGRARQDQHGLVADEHGLCA